MLITQYKAKLPRHLSYPLQAQDVSLAFAGAPDYEALGIYFWGNPFKSAREFQDALTAGAPYLVFAVKLEHPGMGISRRRDLEAQGFYDPQWKAAVYPVSRQQRLLARGLLLSKGLPEAAHWFQQSRSDSWYQGNQRFEVIFSPSCGEIATRERH